MPRSDEPRTDIYSRVTDRIIADLEQGVRPWLKPWHASHTDGRISRPLRHNGLPYSGINVLLLWAEAMEHGFTSPRWMTFRQAQELGAHVRKGERGSMVVYANRIHKTETDAAGREVERNIPFLKAYTVFNVEQIDGLPADETPAPAPLSPLARVVQAEAFFAAAGAVLKHCGNRAFYSGAADCIQLPPFEAFRDAESYYATLAHECIHWTRHPTRLDRDFGRQRFGDEGYAREELVAELGSAFLAADLALTPEVRPDHAAYLANWLKVLKNDKRFIFSAAAHAQRAADFLYGLQPNSQAVPAEMRAA